MSLKFPGTKFSPYRVQCLDRPNAGVMGCNPALDADAYPVVFSGEGALLGTFENCEKRLLASSCMPVCPYDAIEQICSHLTFFMEFYILVFFPKSVEAAQVSWKSDKSNGTVHEEQYTFVILSRWIFRRVRKVSDKFVMKIKIHILYSKTFWKIVPFMI